MINNIMCPALRVSRMEMLLEQLHPVLTYLCSDGLTAMTARSLP